MLHERYYVEKEKQEKLLSRKNVKSDFYNGVYDRYEYPVLTREHIPLTWSCLLYTSCISWRGRFLK